MRLGIVVVVLLMAFGSTASACEAHEAAGGVTTCAVHPAPAGEADDAHHQGTLVCARCDLAIDGPCRSVFQTTSGDEMTVVCGDDVTEELFELTRHGELEVTVLGSVVRSRDGEDLLCISGFSIGTI